MEETGSIHSEDFINPNDNADNELQLDIQKNRYKNNRGIKYYYQDMPGRCIINAVTGTIYQFKVGSKSEKRFWRVAAPVKNINVTEGTKLYYDSPEQYEQHFNIEVDTKLKREWRESVKETIGNEIVEKHKYSIVK